MKHSLKCIAWVLWLGLLTVATRAQETTNTRALPVDVTESVSKGIDFLRAQAATNDDNWIFPALGSRRIIGYETNDVHYKSVEVVIPGYKYEYYEVLAPGNSPSDPMRRVTRSRIVGLDPTKDRKVVREVPDPAGPIIKHNIPIYEKENAVQWAYGALGNNAMAVLALRRCGIRADDPLVTRPANALARLVNTYGMPDNLYDLAWMTAGFAVMPGETFKELTERCAGKLLDAQITTGPATGWWGPVAVNPQLLSGYLRVMSRLGDDRKDLVADLTAEQQQHKKPGAKPTAKAERITADIQKIDAAIAALQEDANRITQLGLLMFDVFGERNYGRAKLTYQGNFIVVESLPYLIQNQISADLDSTALAVLALRVALENDRLPDKTWRPNPPKLPATPGAPPATADFPPPRTPREVIELAGRAVAAARNAGGQWTELNIDQGVSHFSWLKSIPQVKPELFPKLPQPTNMTSICRGAASLANIQWMQTGQARSTVLESDPCRSLLSDFSQGKYSLLVSNDVRGPYAILPQLVSPRDRRGKVSRTDFDTWNNLAEWLSAHQSSTNGAWGRAKGVAYIPSTSLFALRAIIPPIQNGTTPITANLISKNYDKPHLAPGYFMAPQFPIWFGSPEPVYDTTTALLFLADGLPEGWAPPPSTMTDTP